MRDPLNDLGTGTYKGHLGGLYPGGVSTMPNTHRAAGMIIHQRVQPRDSAGRIDSVNGKIVLLSIGMSNCNYEYAVFKPLADADPLKSPYVIVVNGALPTNNAGVISKDTASYWNHVDSELRRAGVTRAQVQAVWLKNAHASVTAGFPEHADSLSRDFQSIVRIIKNRMRFVSVTYLTSRSYAGYATAPLSPEPIAYETGFAFRWLIERQLNGDTTLRFTGSQAPAPFLAWGPYLWADGMNPRSDGLTWSIDDFVESDRTHTSDQGRLKVAQMLLDFFHTDPLARQWYRRPTPSSANDEWSVPLELDLQ
ncbi:MAG: hypothetical protein H7X80_11550 [bacterium]|nr:hypothetical protein [Candidatus Kapabacteria bacterium]